MKTQRLILAALVMALLLSAFTLAVPPQKAYADGPGAGVEFGMYAINAAQCVKAIRSGQYSPSTSKACAGMVAEWIKVGSAFIDPPDVE